MSVSVSAPKTITRTNKYANVSMPLILMAVDYFAVFGAEVAAWYLRNWLVPNGEPLNISWISFYIICPLTYIGFFYANDLYHTKIQFWKIIEKIFKANIYVTVFLVVLMFIAQAAGSTSRLFSVLFFILVFCFIILGRYIATKILYSCMTFRTPLLILGAGKTTGLLLDNIMHDAGFGYNVIGFLEDNTPNESVIERIPHLGKFADVKEVIRETGVQDVMIIVPGLNNNQVQSIINMIQPLVQQVSFVPDMGDIPLSSLNIIGLVDDRAAAFTVKNNLASTGNQILKAVFDIVCTVLGLVVAVPILTILAVMVKRDSDGPIFYNGTRVGKNGKMFSCYKFRSMYVNGDEILEKYFKEHPEKKLEWEEYHKLQDDPRVTKVGAFMRRTSLDELPQIFNVLKLEMSLIGPRPYLASEVEEMGSAKDVVLLSRPGISGYWQVMGRSNVTFKERVQMDTWYVRNWGIWFDMVLLWRTFKVVMNRKGAY